MAWGYWNATSIDRGRSPRRNTSQCQNIPINTIPQSEPPPPPTPSQQTCYSPTCRSPCHSPTCDGSPCQSLCQSRCQSPCENSPPIPPPEDFSRRASLDRQLDSPQVIIVHRDFDDTL